jgi:hypothetical protein
MQYVFMLETVIIKTILLDGAVSEAVPLGTALGIEVYLVVMDI